MPSITKQQAQKFLEDVPAEYIFYCVDGSSARNLDDLQNLLASVTDVTFAYHSGPDKSDFGNWVADVIGDEKLARDLRKAKNRSQVLAAVTSRIAFLKSKI